MKCLLQETKKRGKEEEEKVKEWIRKGTRRTSDQKNEGRRDTATRDSNERNKKRRISTVTKDSNKRNKEGRISATTRDSNQGSEEACHLKPSRATAVPNLIHKL